MAAARAAVGNFAIILCSFLRRDTSESLMRYENTRKLLDFPIILAPGAGIFVLALAEAG
jgi:hypothetical protein